MNKITVVVDDEGNWQAIYLNGEMFEEGHDCNYRIAELSQDWAKPLFPIGEVETISCVANVNYPYKLSDIVRGEDGLYYMKILPRRNKTNSS